MASPFDAPLPSVGQKPWTLNPAVIELRTRQGTVEDVINAGRLSPSGLADAIGEAASGIEANDATVADLISQPTSETATAIDAKIGPVASDVSDLNTLTSTGRLSEAGLSATFAVTGVPSKPQFGGLTLGNTPASDRVALKSSHGIAEDPIGGTVNHVAHLFQSIVVGGWENDAPPDPGFVWGTNFFTTTGTAAGDADGLVALYGGLIEADIRAPAGSSIGTVIGLQAEAAFQSPSAGASVEKMYSMQVAAPVRKDGATAGTAGKAVGLFVQAVTNQVGASEAYSVEVDGGLSMFRGAVKMQIKQNLSTDNTLVIQSGTSQSGAALRVLDSSGGSVFSVGFSGLFSTFGRGVFNASRASQTVLGDLGPAGEAALQLGSAGDTTVYRKIAGVLAMAGQQVFTTGKGTTAQRPAAGTVGSGANYFDTTLNLPIWSNGTSWINAAGTVV